MKEFEDIYNWTTNVGDQSPLYWLYILMFWINWSMHEHLSQSLACIKKKMYVQKGVTMARSLALVWKAIVEEPCHW